MILVIQVVLSGRGADARALCQFRHPGTKNLRPFHRQRVCRSAGGIHATQIVLTDDLTIGDRLLRRLLCLRVWPDGWGGMKNLDLLRYRAEWNAGLLARRRIRQLEASGAALRRPALPSSGHGLRQCEPHPRDPDDHLHRLHAALRPAVGAAARSKRAPTAPTSGATGEIFRAARLIISTSRWAADCLREEYPDCTTEIAVMPNPVELDSFDPAGSRSATLDRSRRPATCRACSSSAVIFVAKAVRSAVRLARGAAGAEGQARSGDQFAHRARSSSPWSACSYASRRPFS